MKYLFFPQLYTQPFFPDCVPFLVQLIHSRDQNPHVREGASSALRNIIHTFDDKKGREKHIFDLLEQLRDYCEVLKMTLSGGYVPGIFC